MIIICNSFQIIHTPQIQLNHETVKKSHIFLLLHICLIAAEITKYFILFGYYYHGRNWLNK